MSRTWVLAANHLWAHITLAQLLNFLYALCDWDRYLLISSSVLSMEIFDSIFRVTSSKVEMSDGPEVSHWSLCLLQLLKWQQNTSSSFNSDVISFIDSIQYIGNLFIDFCGCIFDQLYIDVVFTQCLVVGHFPNCCFHFFRCCFPVKSLCSIDELTSAKLH